MEHPIHQYLGHKNHEQLSITLKCKYVRDGKNIYELKIQVHDHDED